MGEWDQSNFWQLNPAALLCMLATADFIDRIDARGGAPACSGQLRL